MQELLTHPVVLYDGPCGLCQRSVRFLLRHENGTHLRFASLQSEQGQAILSFFKLPSSLDEMVFVENGTPSSGADAALALCAYLRYPAKALGIFRIIPRSLSRRVYRWIARHRYQWFGKKEECLLPQPDQAARFLDAAPSGGV